MNHADYMRKYNATEKGAAYNRAHVRAWRAANPEHQKQLARDYMRRKRAKLAAEGKLSEHYRAVDLKRKYGITVEEYNRMLEVQNGVCAICKRPPQGKHRLAVDHGHTTKVNRGLLCATCNTSLHSLESVENWAEKAVQYLTRSKEKN